MCRYQILWQYFIGFFVQFRYKYASILPKSYNPKRPFPYKPTTIQRDDIDTSTHVELVVEENVHASSVHADPFRVPQYLNIALDLSYVEQVTPIQNNVLEIQEPIYELAYVLTTLLDNRNHNPIDRNYSIEFFS